MGSLYRPSYRAPDGTVKTSAKFWAKYRDALGILRRESTETTTMTEARRFLKQREGAAVDGRVLVPRGDKVTVHELLVDLENEYVANARELRRLRYSLQHLRAAFGPRRAMHVTTADITAYMVARRPRANATINRELAALKRAFTLACRAKKLSTRPYIPSLTEDNVRSGFFERAQLDAVLHHLPEGLRPLLTVAYITGWRMASELFPMQWHQVDFAAGTLRLEPGSTKNKAGRIFPMTPWLRETLTAQREATEALQRELGAIIPWVFHRNGRRITTVQKTWIRATVAAGCPGRIPHDFRRTAVRNLERSGVSRSAAMKLVGHKTEGIYRRYAIVSQADLVEAVGKLAAMEGGHGIGHGEGGTAPRSLALSRS